MIQVEVLEHFDGIVVEVRVTDTSSGNTLEAVLTENGWCDADTEEPLNSPTRGQIRRFCSSWQACQQIRFD